MSLSDIMQFENVIEVLDDGSVIERNDLWAPEILLDCDGDGQVLAEHEQDMIAYVKHQGWNLLGGFTAQYNAGNTPIMHPSEYIGGALENFILNSPGIYATVFVDILAQHEDDEDTECGWAIAFKLTERHDND